MDITHAVLSVLDLLTLEDRSNRYFQNLNKELSLCCVISQKRLASPRRLGDASLGLAPHGLVQSNLVLVHT